MEHLKIFIVEDDPMYSRMLSYHLKLNPDYDVELFSTAKDCLQNLYKNPSIITLDYSLPDMTGGELLKRIKEFDKEIPIIMISGQEEIATAVELLKLGAYDYIVKDNDTKERLWNTVKNLRENLNLRKEIQILQREVTKKYEFGKIIVGSSNAIKSVFSLMEKAIKTNITVSITGDTGTGKELVAKAIHFNSDRQNKPFVVINVSAIPEDLIESEMFGHEKGAFTGALSRRIGRFEEANGGTLFLDEVGEMSLNMQAKLLRVIQEKELSRVGGNEKVHLDARLIVATHRNLNEEVKKGNFREDLYYRLLGLPIKLPSLRERNSDIILLAKHFIKLFCDENKMEVLILSKEAQEKLMKYNYPGNVRELKAVMELAVVMSNTGQIEASDINFHTTNAMSSIMSEEATLVEYERKIIKSYLKKYDDNILLVAEKLDIGKSTIYRMRKNGEV